MGTILPSRTRFLIAVDIRSSNPNRWIITQNPTQGSEWFKWELEHRAESIEIQVCTRTFEIKRDTGDRKLFIEAYGKLRWIGSKAIIETGEPNESV